MNGWLMTDAWKTKVYEDLIELKWCEKSVLVTFWTGGTMNLSPALELTAYLSVNLVDIYSTDTVAHVQTRT